MGNAKQINLSTQLRRQTLSLHSKWIDVADDWWLFRWFSDGNKNCIQLFSYDVEP